MQHTRRLFTSTLLVSSILVAACGQRSGEATAGPGADLIITGGPIVTMQGDQRTTAQAIVVDDGKIISNHPVTRNPADPNKVQVLEIFKQGKSVWVRK